MIFSLLNSACPSLRMEGSMEENFNCRRQGNMALIAPSASMKFTQLKLCACVHIEMLKEVRKNKI